MVQWLTNQKIFTNVIATLGIALTPISSYNFITQKRGAAGRKEVEPTGVRAVQRRVCSSVVWTMTSWRPGHRHRCWCSPVLDAYVLAGRERWRGAPASIAAVLEQDILYKCIYHSPTCSQTAKYIHFFIASLKKISCNVFSSSTSIFPSVLHMCFSCQFIHYYHLQQSIAACRTKKL